MARGEAQFPNTISALLELASESERTAYQRELSKEPEQDEYGCLIEDHSARDAILRKLLEKLRTGEWLASGFGYESGQPTEIHPRLWQRLLINVQRNSAYDGFALTGHKSATGSFHSLGFWEATKSQGVGERSAKEETIAKISALFERLDGSLPPNASKKNFLHEACNAFGASFPKAWLKTAWSRAKLQPARRRAGLKSI